MRALRTVPAGAGVVVLLGALHTGCQPDRFGEPELPESHVADEAVHAGVVRERVLEPLELGFTHPAGVAFSPRAGSFLVLPHPPGGPSEAETELVRLTLLAERAGTVRIPIAVADPVNVTFDGWADRLLLLASGGRQLVEMRVGADGRLDPQALTRRDVRHWGLDDPQGLAVDPASGRLFVLEATGPRIVVVTPDSHQSFGQATVTTVDLGSTGLSTGRGIAFDPATGHVHVLDAAALVLYELTDAGRLIATRDLSALGFRDPQGMTFGPSGNMTDDPAALSLYVADRGAPTEARPEMAGSFAVTGHLTELSLRPPAARGRGVTPHFATAPMVTGVLERTIDVSKFSPPSPDPAGIVYLPAEGDLLISDSEVNEMSIFKGKNLFQMTLTGNLVTTSTTTDFSGEPTGVTLNPHNQHLFVSDDNANKVFEVAAGADGRYGTSDDTVTSISTSAFGSGDPEGVTYHHTEQVLYMVDGVNERVYRIAPGANDTFGDGDDQVTSFSTSGEVADPEGIAYDADFGHLYVVGKPADLIFHYTTSGTLLRTIDFGAANADKPAGMAYAPSSRGGGMSLYIVDRGVDNNSDPRENDGLVYEVSMPPLSGGNSMPSVTITAPANGSTSNEGEAVTFTATASDAEDGNLTPSITWNSSRDGSLGPPGGTLTTSSLSVGTHTITAAVTDLDGGQGADAITVMVTVEGLVTVEVRVGASDGDAEENASGAMYVTSSDLEFVFDDYVGGDQTVGMRFSGVTIPEGATITSAYIQFQVDETGSDATSLTITGEASDDAVPFSSADGDISSRPLGDSSVVWAPVPWTTTGEAGPDQRTPDIGSVVREIVDRPGWASGNAVVILISGAGKRTAEAYDGVPSAAPLLQVEYVQGANVLPRAEFSEVVTDLTVSFTDQSNDPDGAIVSWEWDFGDGNTSSLQHPSHTYASTGTYPVRLTVTDDLGATNSTSHPVTVTGSNQSPTASDVFISGTAQVGQLLTGNYTYADADGDEEGVSTYRWLRDGAPIGTATTTSYALGDADQGVLITFEVTPVAATGASPGEAVASAAVGPVAPEGSGGPSVEVRVASGGDDAEESASGSVSRGSSDLELVFDGGDQTVGMRFNGVEIPPGARITHAYIQFQTDETSSEFTTLAIQGEASDNAAAFASTNGNISSRSRTTSAVTWVPPPWTTKDEAGPDQQTPDIAPVVQEIVNRSGWSSGNSLVILITGSGKRVAESYNGVAGAAPLLRVQFAAGANTVPAASGVEIAGAPIVGQLLTGLYTYSDWDGDPEGSSLYRWLRDGVPISGATGRSYTLVPADEGALLQFEVTPVAVSGPSPGVAVQSPTVGPVTGPGAATLEVRVAASGDDAEENASGSMYVTSSDLEFVFDAFVGSTQTVGMRFTGVTIPAGATITNAYIQFQVDETGSEATTLALQGEAVDDAGPFASGNGNLSSRSRTTSTVAWMPVAWTTKGEAGAAQRTPDLTSILQEIVNRPGWTSGNALVILVTGSGKRTAEAYDGVPSAAPLLHVDYTFGS